MIHALLLALFFVVSIAYEHWLGHRGGDGGSDQGTAVAPRVAGRRTFENWGAE